MKQKIHQIKIIFTYIIEDKEKIIDSASTSDMASENSSRNSFYCATVPSNIDDNNIKYFTSIENKVFLSWNPPSDDGGLLFKNI